ncbi:MAG: hypothetical protein OEZ59_11525 [Deltaproteobacteria bacterium]|nr:hypothetical protein [Deltaproteobacteria bacterium]
MNRTNNWAKNMVALMVALSIMAVAGAASAGRKGKDHDDKDGSRKHHKHDKKGFLHGKPFQYLQGQITVNAENIAAITEETNLLKDRQAEIATELDAVKADVSANSGAIVLLNEDVALVKERLSVNAAALEQVQAELQAVSAGNAATAAQVDALYAEMAALQNQVAADINELNALTDAVQARMDTMATDISVVQQQVAASNADVQTQILGLEGQITELTDFVMNNGASVEDLALINTEIGAMNAQMVALNNMVMTNSLEIQSLQSNLTVMINSNTTGIRANKAAIDALRGDLKNHYHMFQYDDHFSTDKSRWKTGQTQTPQF